MTLKEGDGPVGFGKGIVRFLGLGNNNHLSLAPRVKAKMKGGIPKKEESGQGSLKGPPNEGVRDA